MSTPEGINRPPSSEKAQPEQLTAEERLARIDVWFTNRQALYRMELDAAEEYDPGPISSQEQRNRFLQRVYNLEGQHQILSELEKILRESGQN